MEQLAANPKDSSAGLFSVLKLRTLVYWYLGSAALFALLVFFFIPEGLLSAIGAFSLWFYGTPAAWMLVAARKRGLNFKALLGFRNWKGVSFWGLLGVMFLLEGAALALNGLSLIGLSYISPGFVENALNANFATEVSVCSQSGAVACLAFYGIEAALIAPLLEEVIFRGVLFQRLSFKWGLARGLMLTGLIFGILHVETAVSTFLISIVLTLFYIKYRNLVIPIIIHSLHNLMLFLLSAFSADSSAASLGDLRSFLPAYAGVLAIFGAGLFVYLKKNWPGRDTALPYEANMRQAEAVTVSA